LPYKDLVNIRRKGFEKKLVAYRFDEICQMIKINFFFENPLENE